MDQEVIKGLLETAKEMDAEVWVVQQALWNAHNGMRPVKALNEAIKEYSDIQKDIEENG
ncbi:hypothetical protein [Bacteroides sp.]|uniref:hypothetical protein n=1 Tax=Bacteroides sp. TaxID=29523 RepID=UPI00261AEB89|nr:hypothetical protein [Bacteroides sp.]MDD3037928.1 hypothetical protein [Bacteroides sp.]